MASIINAATSGGLISTADTSGILQLQTASTTAVTVNASQNVGIGTSSPSYKLDVVAASSSAIPARLKGNASGNNNTQLRFAGNNSGTDLWAVGTEVSTSSTGTAFDFYDLTASANRMRLDSAGNLGLGVTPSAWNTSYKALQVGASAVLWSTGTGGARLGVNYFLNSADSLRYISSNFATDYRQSNGEHQFFNAASGTAGNAITFTQAMTLDASGNLGIGTSSPAYKLNIVEAKTLTPTTGDGQITIDNSTSGQVSAILFSSQATRRAQISAGLGGSGNDGFLAFTTRNDSTGFGERARIDSSGNLLVGVTSGSVHTLSKNNSNDIAAQINNTSSSNCYGLRIQTTAVASNSASFYLLRCADSSATRADIRADGGLANYSANNANLSDQRVKTDIQDAGGYLAKICAIPVRTFKYKDQTDDLLNLGCIAQEVEAVAPELVDPSGFGETPDDGVPLKAIYQTDLQYALMKCIQEQQALIQSLKARLDAANL